MTTTPRRSSAIRPVGKEHGDVAGEEFGFFGRGEVPAAAHRGPLPDVLQAREPLPWRLALGDEVIREIRDGGGHRNEVVRTDRHA